MDLSPGGESKHVLGGLRATSTRPWGTQAAYDGTSLARQHVGGGTNWNDDSVPGATGQTLHHLRRLRHLRLSPYFLQHYYQLMIQVTVIVYSYADIGRTYVKYILVIIGGAPAFHH